MADVLLNNKSNPYIKSNEQYLQWGYKDVSIVLANIQPSFVVLGYSPIRVRDNLKIQYKKSYPVQLPYKVSAKIENYTSTVKYA